MTANAHDLSVSLGEWNALVRRARMSDRRKLAALTVSSYADSDGTGILLTPPRLAVDMGVSYSTARRYLTWLRDVGLLEMTHAGNRRLNTASEYRLIIGPDVMEHLEVLSPTEVRTRMDGMRESERDGTRGRVDKMRASNQRSAKVSVNEPDQRSSGVSVNEPSKSAESPEDQRSPRASVKAPINAQTEVDQRSPLGEQHTFPYTPSREDLPSRADDEDLRTDVAVGGAPADSPNPDPPSKCGHGLSAATRADGRPACALCRVEQARALGVHRFAPARPANPPPPGWIAPVIDLQTRETS